MNEESPALPRCKRRDPPVWRYVPEGDSPLFLLAPVPLSKSASTSASKYQTDVRATVPVVQVRGERSCGARRGSLPARLGPHGWPELLRLGQCKFATGPGARRPRSPMYVQKNAQRGVCRRRRTCSMAYEYKRSTFSAHDGMGHDFCSQ